MNPSSIIKRPELLSSLSQEVQKVLYPERGKGHTYNESIECDNLYTNPPQNSISHNDIMEKELTVEQSMNVLQKDNIPNQTNEKSTFYSQSGDAIKKDKEPLQFGTNNIVNQPLNFDRGIDCRFNN